MGLFSIRKNRVYSLTEAKKLLQTEKYMHYTAVAVDESHRNYRLVPEEEALIQVRQKRLQQKQQVQSENIRKNQYYFKEEQKQFRNRLSGNGAYNNIANSEVIKNYNNYQSAKKYQKYIAEGKDR